MKDYYKEKAVSNSSLSWFLKSPRYFKLMFDKEISEDTPSYFEVGQQIHMYILEPEEFEKEYIFMDYNTPKSPQQKAFCESFARARKGTKDEKLLNAYKKAYTTKENDDKILEKAKELSKTYKDYINYTKLSQVKKVLPTSFKNKLDEIRSEILSHKKARELLYNESHEAFGNTDKLFIQNEFPIYWTFPGYDLSCKSMADRLIIDHEKKQVILVDLKTTIHLPEFSEKAMEFNYNRQIVFYWFAIHWYFKNVLNLNIDDYDKQAYIVAVSKAEPTEVKVFSFSDVALNAGLQEIERIIPQLDWHFKEDKWDYSKAYYDGQGIEII